MGRIARTIENILNRINMNLGGSYDNECEHAQPLGSDSRPLANDDGITTQTGGVGRHTALGFFDYGNKVANPGEKRIYGRDADGNVTSHVYLMNDGTIKIENDGVSYTLKPSGETIETNGSGTKTMQPDGTVNINGFIINPDGSVSSPVSMTAPDAIFANSLLAGAKQIIGHNHDQGPDSAGNTEQPTGVNN